MTKAHINLILHIVAQILAQSAVIELFPTPYKPLSTALIAIAGVLVAFSDQSLSD